MYKTKYEKESEEYERTLNKDVFGLGNEKPYSIYDSDIPIDVDGAFSRDHLVESKPKPKPKKRPKLHKKLTKRKTDKVIPVPPVELSGVLKPSQTEMPVAPPDLIQIDPTQSPIAEVNYPDKIIEMIDDGDLKGAMDTIEFISGNNNSINSLEVDRLKGISERQRGLVQSNSISKLPQSVQRQSFSEKLALMMRKPGSRSGLTAKNSLELQRLKNKGALDRAKLIDTGKSSRNSNTQRNSNYRTNVGLYGRENVVKLEALAANESKAIEYIRKLHLTSLQRKHLVDQLTRVQDHAERLAIDKNLNAVNIAGLNNTSREFIAKANNFSKEAVSRGNNTGQRERIDQSAGIAKDAARVKALRDADTAYLKQQNTNDAQFENRKWQSYEKGLDRAADQDKQNNDIQSKMVMKSNERAFKSSEKIKDRDLAIVIQDMKGLYDSNGRSFSAELAKDLEMLRQQGMSDRQAKSALAKSIEANLVATAKVTAQKLGITSTAERDILTNKAKALSASLVQEGLNSRQTKANKYKDRASKVKAGTDISLAKIKGDVTMSVAEKKSALKKAIEDRKLQNQKAFNKDKIATQTSIADAAFDNQLKIAERKGALTASQKESDHKHQLELERLKQKGKAKAAEIVAFAKNAQDNISNLLERDKVEHRSSQDRLKFKMEKQKFIQSVKQESRKFRQELVEFKLGITKDKAEFSRQDLKDKIDALQKMVNVKKTLVAEGMVGKGFLDLQSDINMISQLQKLLRK